MPSGGNSLRQPEAHFMPAAFVGTPMSPRSPAMHNPNRTDRSPHGSIARSALRGTFDTLPLASTMSPEPHAALLLAQGTNIGGGGPSRFFPTSPSSPAIFTDSAGLGDSRYPLGRHDAMASSMSLPQIDPRASVCYGGLFPSCATGMLPNLYNSPRISPNSPRESTSSVRPLRIRKTPPFPFPTESTALHTLERVLRTETKKFRITDFIDIEEGMFAALVEAQEKDRVAGALPNKDTSYMQKFRIVRKSMWDGEEEDETVMDCVRDKMEDEGAGASRWKSERMERSEKRKREREMRLKDLRMWSHGYPVLLSPLF